MTSTPRGEPNAFGCHDPQCGDSTWDHDCPAPPGDYEVKSGVTIRLPDFYFDREGNPISVQRWAELRRDRGYVVIAEDRVGEVLVRTLWLGIRNPGFSADLFGTAIRRDGARFQQVATWSTEEEARQGHLDAVKAGPALAKWFEGGEATALGWAHVSPHRGCSLDPDGREVEL